MGHREHKAGAPSSVGCAVLTVSDSRTPETDNSGRLIRTLLVKEGHEVVTSRIVPDEIAEIENGLSEMGKLPGVRVILITGGTGVSSRDNTPDAVLPHLSKRLEGFGELFRALSYAEIGSAALLSRAVAGVMNGRAVFVMPGSEAAVRLAMERLILPEICHIVRELER